MQPLLTNAFANKHVPTDAIGIQQWTVSPTWSIPRYKENNWWKRENCEGECEEKT
jgi:hypothetical protein